MWELVPLSGGSLEGRIRLEYWMVCPVLREKHCRRALCSRVLSTSYQPVYCWAASWEVSLPSSHTFTLSSAAYSDYVQPFLNSGWCEIKSNCRRKNNWITLHPSWKLALPPVFPRRILSDANQPKCSDSVFIAEKKQQQQQQKAALPVPISVCNIFKSPNNGMAANVWDCYCSHRRWCMGLRTGAVQTPLWVCTGSWL